jgi:hypothetical protein
MYGAAATRAERTDVASAWQTALGRDVAQRIAAGLGAALVRSHQDELVEAAWRQAGDAEQANALIRRAELAAEVTQALARRHIGALESDGEVVSVARPLLGRIRMPDSAPEAARLTVAAAIERTAIPTAALSPALRRAGRLAPRDDARRPVEVGAMLERVEAGEIEPVPPVRLAAGAVGFDQLADADPTQPQLITATPAAVDAAAVIWRRRADVADHGPTRPHGPVEPTPRSTPSPPVMLRRATIPDGEGPFRPPPLEDDETPDRYHISACSPVNRE